MKQVKSLILAVFLVFALNIGARGGDIGSPTTKAETPTYTSTGETAEKDDFEDRLVMEMMLALLTLL